MASNVDSSLTPPRPTSRTRRALSSRHSASSSSGLHHQPQQESRRRFKMPSKHTQRKLLSLAGSVLVALSAGSNYAFSSFAPQLQESLHLTSTQLNVVGVLGNMGVYLSGVLWGRWVDKRGPKVAILIGAAVVLCGYGGLSLTYTHSYWQRSAVLPAVLNLMTGVGNSAAFTAAMNAQAKTWLGSQRGSATATVLAGFGLSAFMYSTLSHELFPGNTGDYLMLLAFGSSLSFLVGAVLIQIIAPSPAEEADASAVDDAEDGALEEGINRPTLASVGRRRTSSDLSARAYLHSDDGSPDEDEGADDGDAERRGLLGGRGRTGATPKPSSGDTDSQQPLDITGRKLIKHHDFQLLFLIMCLISGSGLLLINNVGTVTRTLYEYNHGIAPKPPSSSGGSALADLEEAAAAIDRVQALGQTAKRAASVAVDSFAEALRKHEPNAMIQQEQAHQVSAISLGNASGRILIGFLSDVFVSYVGSARQRVWLLLPVTLLAFSSQVVFALPNTIDNVTVLLPASFATGLMYGGLFGIAPCLTFEIWGLKYAALNWGLASLAPVFSGNIFNLLFGTIFDRHVPETSPSHQCPDGEECYRAAFEITAVATALSVFLAITLIFRRAGLPTLRRQR
ncbi:MFS general substrate transporter [Jaminaea rosea]|uniref:MFS general substrate transporter n=1 Tax=Jaminaea rosea TaxID=1569628 RepID=A0A316UPM9_9BASI|nr:MFS general substrate transporter [Jaminaea rosea]PWN25833.1 MFS general substrate transporter [Jaminaea rosea]